MTSMSREQQVSEIFVQVADSLIDDFDVIEFLEQLCTHCVTLLDVSAAGILLAGEEETLHTVAASDETTQVLELFAVQHDQGPCLDCYREGTARTNIDLDDPTVGNWPDFAEQARGSGFHTSHVFPLRLRNRAVGAMSLFHTGRQPVTAQDASLAQALADVATIALLQQRDLDHEQREKAQLQHALTSRITVEQAKGILAERWNTNPDLAFTRLRAHARAHHLRISDLARKIIDQTLDITQIPRP
ncbi:GAF and ANTAR domain-containing protein [Streptomyces sp. IB2014 016-6]|uniref:GAF and ANTAR domain-containing protein n=1 Tax=Streptomyces sp. IB2014 016-6 TaxID=2517818 RepID=UPI0011C8CF50|nr:GAF and ANTAR domain-containing protein [Streptomyces sp. IB2014 016-6]TXL87790.1 ANTAR domain-containing protein [Streptomyces sp. IB2014 016-6]